MCCNICLLSLKSKAAFSAFMWIISPQNLHFFKNGVEGYRTERNPISLQPSVPNTVMELYEKKEALSPVSTCSLCNFF